MVEGFKMDGSVVFDIWSGAETTQPYPTGEAADAQSGTKVVSAGWYRWMQAVVRFGYLCKI